MEAGRVGAMGRGAERRQARPEEDEEEGAEYDQVGHGDALRIECEFPRVHYDATPMRQATEWWRSTLGAVEVS
jgi:hypothetical protein